MLNVGKKALMPYRNSKGLDEYEHSVWSGHFLLVDINYSSHWLCKRTTKALISLRISAGWSGPALSANCIMALFVCCTSFSFPSLFCFSGMVRYSVFILLRFFFVLCIKFQCHVKMGFIMFKQWRPRSACSFTVWWVPPLSEIIGYYTYTFAQI